MLLPLENSTKNIKMPFLWARTWLVSLISLMLLRDFISSIQTKASSNRTDNFMLSWKSQSKTFWLSLTWRYLEVIKMILSRIFSKSAVLSSICLWAKDLPTSWTKSSYKLILMESTIRETTQSLFWLTNSLLLRVWSIEKLMDWLTSKSRWSTISSETCSITGIELLTFRKENNSSLTNLTCNKREELIQRTLLRVQSINSDTLQTLSKREWIDNSPKRSQLTTTLRELDKRQTPLWNRTDPSLPRDQLLSQLEELFSNKDQLFSNSQFMLLNQFKDKWLLHNKFNKIHLDNKLMLSHNMLLNHRPHTIQLPHNSRLYNNKPQEDMLLLKSNNSALCNHKPLDLQLERETPLLLLSKWSRETEICQEPTQLPPEPTNNKTHPTLSERAASKLQRPISSSNQVKLLLPTETEATTTDHRLSPAQRPETTNSTTISERDRRKKSQSASLRSSLMEEKTSSTLRFTRDNSQRKLSMSSEESSTLVREPNSDFLSRSTSKSTHD